ncbi:hypothetical protein BpHYR1_024241 [Brachionus plicatilis]|uniref:Uncharacterized protein n=1 Tax=Brachionus plicatilis TaxID=10195 RepID=A0A3M7R8X8_BRAPC|nr:hypothetical protein BpHYR1_024241 [Brachionus plicatilis]
MRNPKRGTRNIEYQVSSCHRRSLEFNDINNQLEKYGLFGFQHRALERMLNFGYKIINFANSAPLLKEQYIRNKTKNLNYNLRNGNDFIEKEARTKSGEKTFGFIFTRLANKSIT